MHVDRLVDLHDGVLHLQPGCRDNCPVIERPESSDLKLMLR